MGVRKRMSGGMEGNSGGNFSSALKKPPSLEEGATWAGGRRVEGGVRDKGRWDARHGTAHAMRKEVE
jgi:hypothetical protein